MSNTTMKAIRLHEHGGPEVLRYEEVPVPGLKPGEVLVRVHAVGINPPDWYLRDGMQNLPPETRPKFDFPVIPGTDVSGVVEAVAAGRGRLRRRRRGLRPAPLPSFDGSAYAEYVAAPAADLARKPAGIDHVHAAGAPMSGLTAWQFLIELGHDHPSPFQEARHRPVPLDAGRRCSSTAPRAAWGTSRCNWRSGRARTSSRWRRARRSRSCASSAPTSSSTTPRAAPEEVARDVDLVLDTVGGPDSSRFLRTLKRGGALFPVFFGEYDADEAARLGVTVSGTQVRSNGAQLAELGAPARRGHGPRRHRQHVPARGGPPGARTSRPGHIQGKIVLTVAGS